MWINELWNGSFQKSQKFCLFWRNSVLSDPHLLESLFGGSSRGAQLLVYPWPKTGPPLAGMVVLFDRARSFGRDAHGAVREEGDTRLASQISRINPGDQWGDRCRNQISLTSITLTFWLLVLSVTRKRLLMSPNIFLNCLLVLLTFFFASFILMFCCYKYIYLQ